MTKDLVIDCHADTLLKKYLSKMFSFLFSGKEFQVSKDLLKQGGVDIQVFAIFIPPKLEKLGIELTLEMITLAKEMKLDNFILIESKSDFEKLEQDEESLGMILSLEGAVALERNLQLLPLFYELGVRNIGLSWSRKNLFCEGVSFSKDINEGEGLSSHGKELIEMMDNLGLVIDVSHLNQKGFADVARLTTKPFIASHSNAHQLCSVSRNLRDEQLMQIASADGVVGMNFCPGFLVKEHPEKATIDTVIQHIKYISNLVGVEHVGLGSDFDGIDSTPKGLENAGKMNNIPPLLRKEGFSNQDIAKIMGGNFQRVFEKIWK